MNRYGQLGRSLLMPLTIFASILSVLLGWGAAVLASTQPNIVLFVTDDQSPLAGCYGSPIIQTPHLDALAAEGTLFTHAFATTASCSASRSVILTGVHNHANGQYGLSHSKHKFSTFPSAVALSLPAQLQAEGYRTAHIGKLHVTPQSVYPFEHYLPLGKLNRHNTPAWIPVCESFLNAKSHAPFFLYFCTFDPHRGNGTEKSAPQSLKPNRFGNPPAGEQYPGTKEVIYDPKTLPVPSF
ncbi:MAG: sulfatase-like hydrolase/transferase, partial [Verrucomicrobiales bacterium]